MFKKTVIIEFRNTAPAVEIFTSEKEITLDRVVAYYERMEDFNPERDSVMLLDESETIDLDESESTGECPECGTDLKGIVEEGVGKHLHEITECPECGWRKP